MILPSYLSSIRSRNVTIGHIHTFSHTFSPISLGSLEDEGDSDQSDTLSGTESDLGHTHSLPPGGKRRRVRVLSESEASSAVPGVRGGVPGWGGVRRGTISRAVTVGSCRPEVKRVRSGGAGRQMKASGSWFSFLWSPRETEDELHGNAVELHGNAVLAEKSNISVSLLSNSSEVQEGGPRGAELWGCGVPLTGRGGLSVSWAWADGRGGEVQELASLDRDGTVRAGPLYRERSGLRRRSA
ncbi:hypothetical protein SKAU_G00322030 [Synaphobranchus kaupii]|uniref:Uncharacterized protein n=1 Tax=Synaphobranchus kaupii TaxID=118154 RepID=A0A9Q1ENV0_SYNKA|nr:hypothetical protein SKAU_G00322030 [Synaphobranchus kaupii]